MKGIKKQHLRRACYFGGITGALLGVAVTAWEWSQNVAGIYRDASGTNWQIVGETAWSWFLPSFLCVAVLSCAGLWLADWYGQRRKKSTDIKDPARSS